MPTPPEKVRAFREDVRKVFTDAAAATRAEGYTAGLLAGLEWALTYCRAWDDSPLLENELEAAIAHVEATGELPEGAKNA
jgi:hypothetical protein